MGFFRQAEQFLDLPDGALTGDVHIEIDGTRRVTVDGRCEILEYEREVVRLRVKTGEIRIGGDGLVLESLQADGAAVNGRILSVEFV
ncbi:MAG: YabP/YqfC family sporulation protein [Clostridia bacterium]|nr:YabP/YqfC family sporulation protein [Clostridia bacterium]